MRKIDDQLLLDLVEQGLQQKEIAKRLGVTPAAVCKRLKRLAPLPESLEKLSDKEQKFAIAITEGKTQTQAALDSFEASSRESAKVIGSQLMARSDIQTAVAEIMQQQGLTRTYRVHKLKQHVDNQDPGISLKALDQSWKLDGAYIDRQVHHYPDIKEIDAELADIDKERRQLEAEIRAMGGEIIEGEVENI